MPSKQHRLSKSRFMAGLECERRLWMLVNRPKERREPTLAEAHRMRVGTRFGRDVTRLFPGGVEITASYAQPAEALAETTALLGGDAPALFEAAFLYNDVLIRADVLKRARPGDASWELIEVKSASNNAGNESARRPKLAKHASDMAVQLYVLEGAGISVEKISLAWVNSAYVRHGEFAWDQFVAIEDHSDRVRVRAASIGGEVDRYLELIGQKEMPAAAFGKTKCDACEFGPACWGNEPEDSIIHLPRINAKKLEELTAIGVRRIPEIPEDFELSKGQKPAREACHHPEGKLVKPAELKKWLEALVYPLYFFDFETWNPCIPPFDGTTPYIQIPFQYSLHIQRAPDADLEHREFLADPHGDPRPALIERLIADAGEAGSVVVHSAAFEGRRLEELADFSPPHRGALLAIVKRLVDTEIPFKRNGYLHPGLMGRSSIKVVLPTLVPEMSYDGMEIVEGTAAAITFEEMHDGNITGAAATKARENLLAYCKLDTLAMVEIVERLRQLAG